jgi:hypothetical protein
LTRKIILNFFYSFNNKETYNALSTAIFLRRRKRASEIEIARKIQRRKQLLYTLNKDNGGCSVETIVSDRKTPIIRANMPLLHPPSAPKNAFDKAVDQIHVEQVARRDQEKEFFYERIHGMFLFCLVWSVGYVFGYCSFFTRMLNFCFLISFLYLFFKRVPKQMGAFKF